MLNRRQRQMCIRDRGKTASVAATIMVMLVAGGLAFGGHRYLANHGDAWPPLWPSNAPPQAQEEPAVPAHPLVAMQEVEAQLSRLLEQPGNHHSESEVRQQLDQLQQHHRDLQTDETLTSEQSRQAQWIELSAHFVAAKIAPAAFGDAFRAYSNQLVEQAADRDQAAQIASLQVLQKHPLDQPLDDRLTTDLNHFVQAFPNSPAAVALYAEVSHQLSKNHQSESAKTVLEDGLKRFAGHPQIGLLVNELVEQGHRPPCNPGLTAADWRRLNKRLELSAGASGKQKFG